VTGQAPVEAPVKPCATHDVAIAMVRGLSGYLVDITGREIDVIIRHEHNVGAGIIGIEYSFVPTFAEPPVATVGVVGHARQLGQAEALRRRRRMLRVQEQMHAEVAVGLKRSFNQPPNGRPGFVGHGNQSDVHGMV